MSHRCDEVRMRLPDLAVGRTNAHEAAELEAHLSGCAPCAAELHLVRTLGAHEVQLPAGLESRVRSALDRPDRPARWMSPARLAMAATVVFALVTASLLGGGAEPGDDAAAPVEDAARDGLTEPPAWPAVDEPLMRGGPALYQLSVEELEVLLEELES